MIIYIIWVDNVDLAIDVLERDFGKEQDKTGRPSGASNIIGTISSKDFDS